MPTDVEDWPLPLVAASLNTAGGAVTVNRAMLVSALRVLLGAQWAQFSALFPLSRDLVPASHVFAAAAGFAKPPPSGTGRPVDELFDSLTQVFGALPRLLAILEYWPDKAESDLDRFWGIDYRDRWRFDGDGRRRLTLRQIHARLSHLPADSALALALGKRNPTDLLLMDVFEALTGRAHPSRPLTAAQAAERQKKLSEVEKARNAAADYRRRHQHNSPQSRITLARENAAQSRKAHPYAQDRPKAQA